jgi:hypothetical protein
VRLLVGGDNDLVISYAEVFNCQIGVFPIKYLAVLIFAGRFHVVDWKRSLKRNRMFGKVIPCQ